MGLTILLCDDHKIMLDGLKSILKVGKEFEEIYTCLSAEETLDVYKNKHIDVALIDINMPIMNGIELTEKLKTLYPYTHIIMLTMNNSLGSIQQSLDAGADGYILKNTDRKELVEAIKRVMANGKYYNREISDILIANLMEEKVVKNVDEKSLEITPREIEILKLIVKELSTSQIAERLFISELTVETHRKNIFKKTETKTLVGLVKFAYERKLIDENNP